MKWIIFLPLFSTSAFAHIEAGTYKGKTSDGSDCSMIEGA